MNRDRRHKGEETMREETLEMRDREEKGRIMENKRNDGLFVSSKSLWLVAAGALGALAAFGIAGAPRKIRPAVVGAAKEGYAFKEWVVAKVETAREDVEDIVAEAKHAYHKDLEATEAAVKKEKELLQKVEDLIAARAAKNKATKED